MKSNKSANTKYPVIELIKDRWSPRAFSDKPIPEAILFSLFEAAAWAASSRNGQPWRFICGIKDKGNNYEKIFSSLNEWNKQWAITAPVLVVGVSRLDFEPGQKPNSYAIYDLGQAIANLSIQAIANQIYIHQIGGFEKNKAIQGFAIPDNYEPVVAFALGYLGEVHLLPDEMQQSENKPRSRKELDEILFLGDFK
jgi:nitroreductase